MITRIDNGLVLKNIGEAREIIMTLHKMIKGMSTETEHSKYLLNKANKKEKNLLE